MERPAPLGSGQRRAFATLATLPLLLSVSPVYARPAPKSEPTAKEVSSAEHSPEASTVFSPTADTPTADSPAAASSTEPPSTASAEAVTPVVEARPSLLRGDAKLLGFVATPYAGTDGTVGLGFALGADVGLQRIPLTIGVDMMTIYWGSQTSQIAVQAGDRNLLAERTRDDLAWLLNASLRLQPIDWWIRPYLEGFVGTKLLQTKYSLSFVGSGQSTDLTTDHDWAGSIGWGAGLDLGHPGSANFTLGVRRLSGSRASFSRLADVDGDVAVRYTVPTSNTFFMLGVSGTFGLPKKPDPVTSTAATAPSPAQ